MCVYSFRGECIVQGEEKGIGEKFEVFSGGVYCSKLVWEILLKSKAVSSRETQGWLDDFISPAGTRLQDVNPLTCFFVREQKLSLKTSLQPAANRASVS